MSKHFIVRPVLVVKADNEDEAIRHTQEHLREWYHSDLAKWEPEGAGFPVGTLLHYSVKEVNAVGDPRKEKEPG